MKKLSIIFISFLSCIVAFAQPSIEDLNMVYDVDIDEQTIWLSTYAGIVSIDKASGMWQCYEVPNPRIETYRNYALGIEKRGDDLWLATREYGVGKFRDGHFDWICNTGLYTQSILFDDKGDIFVGSTTFNQISQSGNLLLSEYIPDTQTQSTLRIYDMEPSPDGGVYIGFSCRPVFAGLYKYKDGEFTHLFKDCYHVYALATDTKGNLWIGSEYGLYKYDGDTFTHFTTDNSLFPSGKVRSVEVDDKGNVWIGVNNQLAKYDGKEFTYYETEENTKYYFTSICIDGDVIYLVRGGLVMFRFENGKIEKMEICSTDYVNGNIDGIQEITERRKDDDASFSLDGRRVTDSYHGIVIKDGKKLIRQ